MSVRGRACGFYYMKFKKTTRPSQKKKKNHPLPLSLGPIEFVKYPADRNPCQYKIIIHRWEYHSVQMVQGNNKLIPVIITLVADVVSPQEKFSPLSVNRWNTSARLNVWNEIHMVCDLARAQSPHFHLSQRKTLLCYHAYSFSEIITWKLPNAKTTSGYCASRSENEVSQRK